LNATQRRATQSLIGTIQWCLHHPSILGYELLWRWTFGIPALWIALHQVLLLWDLVPQGTWLRLQAAAYDPVQASVILVALADSLTPTVLQILQWMLPTFLVAWAVVSGLGRWLVLRRLAAFRQDLLPRSPAPLQAVQLILFQALRIAGLSAIVAACYGCIHLAAGAAFAETENPNLVFYFAAVIISVLSAFTAWALISWTVTLAPLLLVRDRKGIAAAFALGVRPGRNVTGKLTEINLVLGIVKLALLVLAMVFSAIPLPFESATTPHELHTWWAMVTIAYLVVNAFFQVGRLVATLESVNFAHNAGLTQN
jgi:hypothetical protein